MRQRNVFRILAATTPIFTLSVAAASAFEGRISAVVTQGNLTTPLLYTVGTNQLRIERTDTNWPHALNLVDLQTGALTLLFPHNRSFVRVKPASENAASLFPDAPTSSPGIGPGPAGTPAAFVTPKPPTMPQMPGSPTSVGPISLSGMPTLPTLPEMPAPPPGVPPGIGPAAAEPPGARPMPPTIGPTNMAAMSEPPRMPAMPEPPDGFPQAAGPTALPGTPTPPATPPVPTVPARHGPGMMSGVGPQPGRVPGLDVGLGTARTLPMRPIRPIMFAEGVEFKATGQRTNLHNYVCEKYELRQRGDVMEIWATGELFPFRSYQENQPPQFGPRTLEEQWPELMRQRQLFPLLVSLRFESGPERYRFEVRSIQPEKIADPDGRLFQPPPDYQEIEAPSF